MENSCIKSIIIYQTAIHKYYITYSKLSQLWPQVFIDGIRSSSFMTKPRNYTQIKTSLCSSVPFGLGSWYLAPLFIH